MVGEYSLLYTNYIYYMTMICMIMVAAPYYNLFKEGSISDVRVNRISKLSGIIIMSALFALVFGMRWDVGMDNLTYLRIYTNNETSRYSTEFLFKFMNDALYKMGVHYAIYFIIFAFIQVFLLYYTFKNEAYLWVFLTLSLFGGHFFYDWMNGMRQEMASCIMLFGTNFIIARKPWKYLLCIIFAAGFHISAVLFIFIYPIMVSGKKKVPNIKSQLIILAICAGIILIVGDILSRFFPILDVLKQVVGEKGYMETYNEQTLQRFSDMTNIGVMFYIFLMINVIIMAYSNRIISFFGSHNRRKIIIYYNLYFWGTIFETLLATNMVLIRPFRYFRIYKLIFIAYLLYYIYKHPSTLSTTIFWVVVMVLIGCVGVKAITAPFNFFFEVSGAP